MKNALKIILIIIGIFILLVLLFFSVDYSRMQKQEKPIFCILDTEVNDGGTKIYLGLGYKVIDFHTLNGFEEIKIGTWFMDYDNYKDEITKNSDNQKENNLKYARLEDTPLDYNFADMVEDSCYVLTNSNVVYHEEELYNFIKNVENNKSDEIRIVRYTIEGQPILTNLEYKDNKFILQVDSRRDGYAKEEDKKITIDEFDANKYKLVKEDTPYNKTKLVTYYNISLKSLETGEESFTFPYVEVKNEENPKFEIKFNKNLER